MCIHVYIYTRREVRVRNPGYRVMREYAYVTRERDAYIESGQDRMRRVLCRECSRVGSRTVIAASRRQTQSERLWSLVSTLGTLQRVSYPTTSNQTERNHTRVSRRRSSGYRPSQSAEYDSAPAVQVQSVRYSLAGCSTATETVVQLSLSIIEK